MSEVLRSGVPVDVSIRVEPAIRRVAYVSVKTLSRPTRLWLAFKSLFFCVVVAALCILVPLVHFVLTPAWLIGGVIVFIRKASQGFYMGRTSVRCPKCDGELKLPARAFHWPRREYCYQCRNEIVIAEKLGE